MGSVSRSVPSVVLLRAGVAVNLPHAARCAKRLIGPCGCATPPDDKAGTNRTSFTWLWILLRFDLVSRCKTESPRSWTLTIPTDVGWSSNQPLEKQHKIPLVELMNRISDSAKDCSTEVTNVSLVFAQTFPLGNAPTIRIDGSGKAVDSETGYAMVTLAESKMHERLLYTETIETPAIDRANATVRVKREQEKAAESAKLKANCVALYRDTAEKKVSDLTVAEAQAIGACQALGFYSGD